MNMARYAEKNLFIGVNPILNSFLQQNDGGWESFHAEFISSITHQLDSHLPSNYYAIADKGLQISEIGLDEIKKRRIRPDVGLYQVSPSSQATARDNAASPVAILPLRETLELEDEDNYLLSVNIYEAVLGKLKGKLVSSIEVLSPANKAPSAYHVQYLSKRAQLLKAQVNLVELDLLHESRPVISNIPSYPDQNEGALPYTLAVSKPQPSFEDGEFVLYGAKVDAALPQISIPLMGTDTIVVDVQAIYNKSFSGLRVFASLVDYEQLPVNFERYHSLDQARIKELLDLILSHN
jgi:hypothetical protein